MSAQSAEVTTGCNPATCSNAVCPCRIRQINLAVVVEELQKPDSLGLPRLSFDCGSLEPNGAS